MLAYSEDRFGERRTLGVLVAFWVVAVIGLAILAQLRSHETGLPANFGQMVYVAAWSLVPGILLGGWKAILVAAGRSTVTRRRDRIFIRIFTFWVVGSVLIAYTLSLSSPGTL